MNKVFYVEEIFKMEQLTCAQKQITNKDLMYQAGYVLTKDFLSRVMPDIKEEILVVAGTGNNGGDALVVYQELKHLGYAVKLVVIGDVEKASEGFLFYLSKISDKNDVIPFDAVSKAIMNAKYIIDGIFGTGLKKEVLGDYKYLIKTINSLDKIVYSIDLPSGINPDSGEIMKIAVKACYTGVVGNYKLGNFLNDALDYHGDMKLLDIGILEGYSDIYYLDYNEVDLTKKRLHNSHKYSYGNNAFIGSSKMPGAINLAALAALRCGIGLAEVFYDSDIVNFSIETIYKKLEEKSDFSLYDVVVFGPGITEVLPEYQKVFSVLVDQAKKLVVDAGGLKYLDLNKKYKNVVITPHLKEFSDLLKIDRDILKKNPISYLRKLSETGLITLLKGPTTIVQEQRYTYLMQSKNTGLATAGSGDVLAGIVSSYLVDEDMINACVKGVATHSKAAYYAREKKGEVSMISSDLIDNIYKVWVKKK
ncbi:MAG: NAD(P)H-hydrate dehydratase [Candidatus Izemoplasmatales bacterium]